VPYERPPLSKGFLLGTSGQVPVKDAAWYEQASVELILGSRATRLDLAARTVTLSGGAVLGYDRLLLATGVRPRVLPGLDGDGVCYLRTGEDAAALRDRMTAAGHVAVLGGGFIGCEVAAAAVRLGKRATIMEALPTLLHRALGPELGDIVAGIHRDEGVDVRTGQQVLGIRPRRGGVRISTAAGDSTAVVGVGTRLNPVPPNKPDAVVTAEWTSASPPRPRLPRHRGRRCPAPAGARTRVGSSTTTPPFGTGASRPATCSARAVRRRPLVLVDQFDHTISARDSSRNPAAPGAGHPRLARAAQFLRVQPGRRPRARGDLAEPAPGRARRPPPDRPRPQRHRRPTPRRVAAAQAARRPGRHRDLRGDRA
jgi:hypothetical protein